MPGNPYEGRQYGYCGGGYGYCGTPAAGAALLLDNLAATYGAWSVARQIHTAYSGALIRVREDSGNTEEDIPVANGVLDECDADCDASGATFPSNLAECEKSQGVWGTASPNLHPSVPFSPPHQEARSLHPQLPWARSDDRVEPG